MSHADIERLCLEAMQRITNPPSHLSPRKNP